MHAIKATGYALYNPPRAGRRGIGLAKELSFSFPASFGNRDGVPKLRDVDSNRCLFIVRHSSFSDQDRSGRPSNPWRRSVDETPHRYGPTAHYRTFRSLADVNAAISG